MPNICNKCIFLQLYNLNPEVKDINRNHVLQQLTTYAFIQNKNVDLNSIKTGLNLHKILIHKQ